ncbi:putative leucine-rich repeat domain superfamily [Dioscorea sansibarensis]
MPSVIVEKHARSSSLLTVLDISYCLTIDASGIEVFSNNCLCLVHLKKNMPPPENELPFEDKALVIENTMPILERLELAFDSFNEVSLDSIHTNCKALKHLDICGCRNVRLGPICPKNVSIRSIRDLDKRIVMLL